MAARRVRAAGALVVMLAAGLFGPSAAQAVSGGNPVAEGRYGFAVKVESTARSCSGALVDPQWVLTAASCFPENIANGQTAPSGAPKVAFTAIVGRTNLSTSAGHQVAVVDLVGRSDRNVVLAKLATRVTDIAPVPIATAPPATGEVVRVAGYGRTATEWVPGLLHTGQFTVDAVHPAGLDVTGQGTAAICKGDAGGPAFRETDNRVELVAINDRSWQGGCYREDETRRGATQSRLDDLTGWVTETTRFRGVAAFYDYGGARTGLWLFDDVAGPGSATPRKPWESGTGQWDFARTKPMSGDFTGDGRLDIAALYDNGGDTTALWLFENVGAPTPPEPRKVWQSGAGNWTFDRTTPLAGDFDGNGTADIAAMYHYGNGHVRVFLFDHVATPSEPHNRITWDSGPGAWDPARAKPVTGDFDNDGRTDIAALYNYDNATTGLWLFDRVAAGGTPFNRQVWGSGAGNWAFDRTTPLAGDFDGNGTADIAAMYHYGNGHVRVFLFDHVATPSEPHNRITWDSGPGAWDPARAKPVTGDFDNDGRTDIAALYNYDNATTGLWLFDRVAAGGTPFNRQVWGSGAGNWAFDRTTPVPGPGA